MTINLFEKKIASLIYRLACDPQPFCPCSPLTLLYTKWCGLRVFARSSFSWVPLWLWPLPLHRPPSWKCFGGRLSTPGCVLRWRCCKTTSLALTRTTSEGWVAMFDEEFGDCLAITSINIRSGIIAILYCVDEGYIQCQRDYDRVSNCLVKAINYNWGCINTQLHDSYCPSPTPKDHITTIYWL